MGNWWDKPFSIEVDGQPWAVLTDKVCLIGIQGPNKLPPLDAEPHIASAVKTMLKMQEKEPQTTSLDLLSAFLTDKDYVTVKGVPLDAQRLTKVLAKVKKSKDVALWDATCDFFAWKCLGLVVPAQGWKAFLMGVRDLDEPTEGYEFEIDPRAMFDEVMGGS